MMAIASKTSLRTAWKESPAVIRAMGDAKHFLLVSRVGHERPDQEARYLIRHLEFFLLPRRMEDPADRVRPEFSSYLAGPADHEAGKVTIRYRALVTEGVTVMEHAPVEELSPYHIWTDSFLREQLRWNPKDPAYVVTCKVQRLDPPLVVPCREEYDGPEPWVTLQEVDLPPMAFESVLDNKDYLKVVVDVKKLFADAHRNPLEAPEPEKPAAEAQGKPPDAPPPPPDPKPAAPPS